MCSLNTNALLASPSPLRSHCPPLTKLSPSSFSTMSSLDSSNVWLLSRQKLQRAADESGDTLRRSVLIHNIIKQHSQPPSPVHPTQNVFVFPTLDDTRSTADEEDWLDGLLHDLDDDVHVSVLPVDPSSSGEEAYSSNYSLFPSHCPSSTSVSTCPRPYESLPLDSSLFDQEDTPDSPPTSPPALMEHSVDSDEDEDWDPGYINGPPTPSVPAVCLGDHDYFMHLPFCSTRHGPLPSHHQYIFN